MCNFKSLIDVVWETQDRLQQMAIFVLNLPNYTFCKG